MSAPRSKELSEKIKSLFPNNSLKVLHDNGIKRLSIIFANDEVYEAALTVFGDHLHPLGAIGNQRLSLLITPELIDKLSNAEQFALLKNALEKNIAIIEQNNKAYAESIKLYQEGQIAEKLKQYHLARNLYQAAANLGYMKAKTNLGLFYLQGKGGINRNPKKAQALWLEAAESGHTRAQFNLAKMLEEGDGVKKDLWLARQWYKQVDVTTRNGHPGAKRRIKCVDKAIGKEERNALASTGDGQKERDLLKEADQLLQKGMDAELAFNKFDSETWHEHMNKAILARICYEQAAELGHIKAKTNLGLFYLRGKGGLERNPEKTYQLWSEAAEAGHSRAQFNLAVMLEKGDGIPQDLAKAKNWYQKIIENSNGTYQTAITSLKRVEEAIAKQDEVLPLELNAQRMRFSKL